MPKRSRDRSRKEEELRVEFNRWAADERGDGMEGHHLPITLPVLRRMRLHPGDRVLDLGCGTGWATRLVAARVRGKNGRAVGLDISDAMVHRARRASRAFRNIAFLTGSSARIPWKSGYFNKVISIESFYYYPDLGAALDELLRVMSPRGRLYILINLCKDNPCTLRWVSGLGVPVHVLSAREYLALLRKHGFVSAQAAFIRDPSPVPRDYSGKWFRNAAELRAFKRIGALLLMASKPAAPSASAREKAGAGSRRTPPAARSASSRRSRRVRAVR